VKLCEAVRSAVIIQLRQSCQRDWHFSRRNSSDRLIAGPDGLWGDGCARKLSWWVRIRRHYRSRLFFFRLVRMPGDFLRFRWCFARIGFRSLASIIPHAALSETNSLSALTR